MTIYKRYMSALARRPLGVKMLTSGVIAFSSDLICQQFVTPPPPSPSPIPSTRGDKLVTLPVPVPPDAGGARLVLVPVDWDRTVRFTVINIAWSPVILHFWYGILSKRVALVPLRVLLDQFAFAPVGIGIFFVLNTTLAALQKQGQAADWSNVFDDVKTSLRHDFPPTIVANWILWIPAMSLNFRFVAPPLQVLFSNCVGLVWNIYLSARAAGTPTKKKEKLVEEVEVDDDKHKRS